MRIKGIRQHDERDCGPACLATVAQHYGLRLPLVHVRELCKVDKGGANIYALVQAAQKLGFACDALQGEWADLQEALQSGDMTAPFIAHIIKDGMLEHYVVVFRIDEKGVHVFDPGFGKTVFSAEEFQESWTGYVVDLRPSDSFEPGNAKRGLSLKFLRLLLEQKGLIATTLLVSILLAVLSVCVSFSYQLVIDGFMLPAGISADAGAAVLGADADAPAISTNAGNAASPSAATGLALPFGAVATISGLFAILLCIVVLQMGFSIVRGCLFAWITKRLNNSLIDMFLSKVLRLPLHYFHDRKTGEILSRYYNITEIREAISGICLSTLLDFLMVLVLGVVLCLVSPLLFLLTFGVSAAYLVVVICFIPRLNAVNRRAMEADAQVSSSMKEAIDGIETAKAFCAEERMKGRIGAHVERFIHSFYQSQILQSVLSGFVGTVEGVGALLILWLGSVLVLDGQITLGTLITFESLAGFFTASVKNIVNMQPTLQTAYVAIDRLNDVLEVASEDAGVVSCEDGVNQMLPLDSLALASGAAPRISFEGVRFSYGYRREVLHSVSFSIPAGQRVALVGPNGCGKTTIARLLLRFYDPDQGCICLDGVDVRQIPLEVLRRRIAYVSQEVFLFADTLRNNLTLGAVDVPDEAIYAAIEECQLGPLLQSLPFGLDSVLDENGRNLSGGQRQRIAIARALLVHPEVIIFDEATSNIDRRTEQALLDGLFAKLKDCTLLVIAHRRESIEACERVLSFREGQIVADSNEKQAVLC